jgi:YggT family protein
MLRGPGESQAARDVRAGCGPNQRPLASADLREASRVIDILFELAFYVINLFKWAVILAAIFSLLTAFGVLDTRNRIVWTIGDFLFRITEPVLRPIRNMLPNLGGIDLSPWIVVVLIQIAILPMLSKLHMAITYGAWQPLVL